MASIQPTGCRMKAAEVCAPKCKFCMALRTYLLIIGLALWIPGAIFTVQSDWREQRNILEWGAYTMLILGLFLMVLGLVGWIFYMLQTEMRVRSKLAEKRRNHVAMIKPGRFEVTGHTRISGDAQFDANQLPSTSTRTKHGKTDAKTNNYTFPVDVESLESGSELGVHSVNAARLTALSPIDSSNKRPSILQVKFSSRRMLYSYQDPASNVGSIAIIRPRPAFSIANHHNTGKVPRTEVFLSVKRYLSRPADFTLHRNDFVVHSKDIVVAPHDINDLPPFQNSEHLHDVEILESTDL